MAEYTETDLLEMDDEDFEEMSANLDEQVESPEEVVEDTQGEPEVIDEGSEEIEADSEETEEVEEEQEVSETEEDTLDDTETAAETIEEESPDSDTGEEPTAEDIDYKTTYDTLMKPIKVSGREVQIKSAQDARNLISMGIDYSRNMRDLKPLRAISETLVELGLMDKDSGVVDEAALLRLGDINKGNTDALGQLMADKKIDPLDVNTEDVEYTPTQSMVTQQSVAIQDVEAELASRGSVDRVITKLGELDDRSKQFFNETPSNLLKLDDDIQNGSYDNIMGAVQYEKSLGRLGDMSDMEAYIHIASQQVPNEEVVPTTPKPSTNKRKAAGISKRGPVNKTVQKVPDIVGMSDEEFEKLAMMDNPY